MTLLIREKYIEKILKRRDEGYITLLGGIRYSGKSTVLKQTYDYLVNEEDIPSENVVFIDLRKNGHDEQENARYISELIDSMNYNLEGSKYIFIDNIEYANNWGRILHSRCKYQEKLNVYIAPSNSNITTNENVSRMCFVNRITIFPFSFNEYIEYSKLNSKDNIKNLSDRELFEEYQRFGGLPEAVESDKDDYKCQIRDWSYRDTICPDIYNLYHRNFVKMLIRYLIEEMGQEFKYNVFHKFINQDSNCNFGICNLSSQFLEYYMLIVKNMGLLMPCGIIDLTSMDLKWREKVYYLSDSSFYYKFMFYDVNPRQIYESMVYVELLRRDFDVSRLLMEDGEITFVHKQEDTWIYIQVEKTIKDEKIRKEVFDKLNQNENGLNYIISLDETDCSTNNIKHLNIIDFLKDEDIIKIDEGL